MKYWSTGATISACGQYRYNLWRRWSELPTAVFCMLNPSTADASVDDPTITRCVRRAKNLGYGGIEVVNLFALRSTDPEALYSSEDPVGPENDQWINRAIEGTELFICGWGNHGKLRQRDKFVHSLVQSYGLIPHVLKINKDGSPAHPLYIGYNVKPVEWGVIGG